jgi:hypothetical protein
MKPQSYRFAARHTQSGHNPEMPEKTKFGLVALVLPKEEDGG